MKKDLAFIAVCLGIGFLLYDVVNVKFDGFTVADVVWLAASVALYRRVSVSRR